MSFDKRLFIWLAIAFVFSTVVGTLLTGRWTLHYCKKLCVQSENHLYVYRVDRYKER